MIDQVPRGAAVSVDGQVLTSDKAGGMWERRKMAWNGHPAVSIVIAKGKVEDGLNVVARGFSEPDGRPADESMEPIDEAAENAIAGMKRGDLADDEEGRARADQGGSPGGRSLSGKRPLVDVTIHRI